MRKIRKYGELERAYHEILFGWQEAPEALTQKNPKESEHLKIRMLKAGWEDKRLKERNR